MEELMHERTTRHSPVMNASMIGAGNRGARKGWSIVGFVSKGLWTRSFYWKCKWKVCVQENIVQ